MKKIIFILVLVFMLSCEKNNNQCSDLEYVKTSNISVHFSPNNNLESILINMLKEAKESVDIAIYDLTNGTIVDSFIKLHKNGIEVRVYCDKNINPKVEKPLIDKLKNNGITVKIAITSNWVNVNPHFAIMHNKFIVVDQKTVLTGSYNFTKNAENNNRENFIIIKNELIALEYQKEFERYWNNP